VKDVNTKEVIVKIVNTKGAPQKVNLNFKNTKLESKGELITLKGDQLNDENSFAAPKKISPITSTLTLNGTNANLNLAAYSVTVVKIKMK
jgi:alpha-N-arabinofuranosidase